MKGPKIEDSKESMIEEATKVKVEESQELCSQAHFKDHPLIQPSEYITAAQSGLADLMPVSRSSCNGIALLNATPKGMILCAIKQDLKVLGFVDFIPSL